MTQMYHNLPVNAYTSQDWFDREQRLIFSRTWRYAGLVEDIPEPGHYVSVQAGLNNIFIVMGRDFRLRAFHNICRHRGTQLIRALGKTQKALTCPYHDWTYDLEGNLISVPDEAKEYPKGIDKSCLGLKPAAVDVWRGMMFVHPDPDSPSLVEFLAGVDPHLGPHKPEELVEYEEARQTYEIKANWKIVVENYIDVYHLSHLHANTLHMYDHAKAEFGWKGPHYHFWEPPSEAYAKDLETNLPTPRVIPEPHKGAWVPMLFPGLGLGASEDSWNLFVITPLAPDLTRIENRTKLANVSSWEYNKQSWSSAGFWKNFGGPKYSGDDVASEDDPMASGDFTAEDIYACEQQQKSLASPYLEIGPASVGESPITNHQNAILDFMAQQEKRMT
ncbi:aromatic ring-hydroxylating dioxygenase subunit alpha [Parasedimentitalea maritima]|uniref:Aromatic ring-hydroxylating dioxygenase subunit alpha n=1 Tax=Parasedimentitalea maritima TaxID=2578117 RepID=A0ABY2UTM5_9RHOB|nr:aromatic ring-hydroxylating dioxygenase subunit alpha [Zongyanglinia marina]TLP58524.1 aromatic ring-hydroxylating dioxygenase subunit alpha [Zongyanglinia marina]